MSAHSKKPAIIFTRFPYESEWGGEESHTLVLARYFRDKGFEVIFMGNCKVLLQKFQDEGFQVCPVNGGKMIVTPFQLAKSFLLFPFWKRSMRKAFQQLEQEYDLKALYCLSLNEKLFLTPDALKLGIPVTWVEHQEIRNWLLKNPWRHRYKKLAEHVKIVPISKKNHRVLTLDLGIPEKNVVEVVHGVALDEISKIPRKTKKGLIVAANRLIPKKGIMDFLAAVKILLNEKMEIMVRVVGEGEGQGLIEGEIRVSRLRFGEVDITLSPPLPKNEWHTLLSQADVYVSCARDTNETFSLNTAEAMAAGCKVVVTRCSGIADYLTDEADAFLAKPNDPVDLAKKIQLALKIDDKMREKAIQTAREKFDLKRMLKEYEGIILRKI